MNMILGSIVFLKSMLKRMYADLGPFGAPESFFLDCFFFTCLTPISCPSAEVLTSVVEAACACIDVSRVVNSLGTSFEIAVNVLCRKHMQSF